MSTIKETIFDLVGVGDSSNRKVVKSVVKAKYLETKISDLKYVILDKQNIIVYHKNMLNINSTFIEKIIYAFLEKWNYMKKEQKGGLFIFEINNLFYTISYKNKKMIIEYSDMDINLATVLSLYENFKNKSVYFFYEDSPEINSLFISLSDMLSIDIDFFKKYPASTEFNLKSISNSFGESVVDSVKIWFNQKKDNSDKSSAVKEFLLKNKLIIGGVLFFSIISSAGYFGYLKYEEKQKLEREEALFLAEKERMAKYNNLGSIKKMNYNEALVTASVEFMKNNSFDSIKTKKNLLEIVSRNKTLAKEKEKENFKSFDSIKMGLQYVELKSIEIESPKLNKKTKEEIAEYKEKEEFFAEIQKKNFNNYSVLNQPSKRSLYMINKYHSKKEVIKAIESFKYMNDYYLSFYLFKISKNNYELITTLRK